ncbi:hypothetical protein M8C21_019640 [Ambrosia artemisiifolia]|uniref:Uncharacterized protein n=1 Tax=Ambrosia artemisiifolia TaxID=4212 RepID=A0AAD5GET0_AMBAR|nr:hypothetical protein M8C21_019640 [Ambrosia artemisiifolia]
MGVAVVERDRSIEPAVARRIFQSHVEDELGQLEGLTPLLMQDVKRAGSQVIHGLSIVQRLPKGKSRFGSATKTSNQIVDLGLLNAENTRSSHTEHPMQPGTRPVLWRLFAYEGVFTGSCGTTLDHSVLDVGYRIETAKIIEL